MSAVPKPKQPLRMMIVDDSNVMRRRIERSQQNDQLEVVVAVVPGELEGVFALLAGGRRAGHQVALLLAQGVDRVAEAGGFEADMSTVSQSTVCSSPG